MQLPDRLRKIAETMQMMDRKPGVFSIEDYYELVIAHYQNLKREQENAAMPISDETLLKVTERQLAELIRMGRAHKLMRKVNHVTHQDHLEQTE